MDILPSSRLQQPRGSINRGMAGMWVPIFCANCGADGGYVPEVNKDFAFYLCQPCADVWSPLVGTMMIPDEVFWQKVKESQLDQFGRELTPEEIVELLKDDRSQLSRLAKDRPRFGG